MFRCAIFKEADLVTTHELGHNFGAEHDPDGIAECAPSEDQGGKFVMYPIAVSGDYENNKVCVLERLDVVRTESGCLIITRAHNGSVQGWTASSQFLETRVRGGNAAIASVTAVGGLFAIEMERVCLSHLGTRSSLGLGRSSRSQALVGSV